MRADRTLRVLALAGAVLALVLVARAPAAPADDPTTPTRIISCAPNLTQMLFALGAGDQVVGVTRYCQDPPEAATRPAMGDLFSPNLEAMVAADPDMVVAYPSSAKVIDFFNNRQAIRLVVTNTCETREEIARTMRDLGRALGREDRAEELIAATNADIARLEDGWKDEPPLKVLIVVGRQPGSLANLYAAGRGTYLDELLTISGAENVVPGELGKYPVLNREAILSMRPDVIIETHHEEETDREHAEARAAWKAMSPLPAVRDGRILFLMDKRVLLPGAFLERDARTLHDLIRPETVGTEP
ncbi:ABC transporter substrate-binding protein [bacterium]|nr:ABC transporter substrate-binding protein [bacterium]